METNPHAPSRKDDRAECRVGDWVLADSVPEWPATHLHQPFVPPGQILPAVFAATAAPVAVPPPQQWVFRGSYFIDNAGDTVRIWRRES